MWIQLQKANETRPCLESTTLKEIKQVIWTENLTFKYWKSLNLHVTLFKTHMFTSVIFHTNKICDVNNHMYSFENLCMKEFNSSPHRYLKVSTNIKRLVRFEVLTQKDEDRCLMGCNTMYFVFVV
jgi:hypothetical protein